MLYLRLLLFSLLVCAAFGRTAAMVRYDIPNLTSRDISEMIQDAKGFLWIGTDNGLNRFDGWSNVTFTHNMEDTLSLKNNMVEALFNDSHGRLWIGTGGGLQRYEEGSDRFSNVEFPGSSSPSVRSIIQRGNEELLVVTSGFGAFSVDTRTMKAERMDTLNNIIGTQYAHVIRMDPLNRIWIGGAGNRLTILDKNLNELHSATFPEKILDIVCDKDNDVCVVTDYNVFRWNASEKTFGKISGEPGWRITGAMTDREGDIIIHTLESGVFRIHSGILSCDATYASIKEEGILNMYEDRDGDIWTGTRKGGLLMQSSAPEMFRFHEISTPPLHQDGDDVQQGFRTGSGRGPE